MAKQWIAYEGIRGTKIRLDGEPRPMNVRSQRPANRREIIDEIERRADREAVSTYERIFNERQDVKDARAVSYAIEWMDQGEGLVDRLTPAKWAELRKRLT